jgi:hypothetical protein
MADLVFEDHFSFLHFFHCYDLFALEMAAKSNLTKSSSSNNCHGSKIVNRQFHSSKNKLLNPRTFAALILLLFG